MTREPTQFVIRKAPPGTPASPWIAPVLTSEEIAEREAQWKARAERLTAERSALTQRLDGLTGLPKAIADLHSPEPGAWPRCTGCDVDGAEAEIPEWPCRTIDTLIEWMELTS